MDIKYKSKKAAAEFAVTLVPKGQFIGVGSGSTVNIFIDELSKYKTIIPGCVPSSEQTRINLIKNGLKVVSLDEGYPLTMYFDGADELNRDGQMIKGGGGALTREKIVAAASAKFICIIDDSKLVESLGKFPLPLEVIPMAAVYVKAELVKLGGIASTRTNFQTDNGNIILDVIGLDLSDPDYLEKTINSITGVVTNGLFASRKCDEVIIGSIEGVESRCFD